MHKSLTGAPHWNSFSSCQTCQWYPCKFPSPLRLELWSLLVLGACLLWVPWALCEWVLGRRSPSQQNTSLWVHTHSPVSSIILLDRHSRERTFVWDRCWKWYQPLGNRVVDCKGNASFSRSYSSSWSWPCASKPVSWRAAISMLNSCSSLAINAVVRSDRLPLSSIVRTFHVATVIFILQFLPLQVESRWLRLASQVWSEHAFFTPPFPGASLSKSGSAISKEDCLDTHTAASISWCSRVS